MSKNIPTITHLSNGHDLYLFPNDWDAATLCASLTENLYVWPQADKDTYNEQRQFLPSNYFLVCHEVIVDSANKVFYPIFTEDMNWIK